MLDYLAGRGLSPNAKLAAFEVANFEKAFFSPEYLAQKLEIARSTAYGLLHDLEVAGVLERTPHAPRGAAKWRLLPRSPVSPRVVPAAPPQEAEAGHLEATGSERDPSTPPPGSERDPSPETEPVQIAGLPESSDLDHKQKLSKQEFEELQAARAELAVILGGQVPDPVAASSDTDEASESSPAAPVALLDVSCKIRSRASDGSRRAHPGLAKASGVALATEQALVARWGVACLQPLRGVLRARKWARPGLAELACQILLRERPGAREPHLYLHRLWDEADKRLDLAAEAAEARTHEDSEHPRAPPGARAPSRSPPPAAARSRPLTGAARAAAALFVAQDFAALREPPS